MKPKHIRTANDTDYGLAGSIWTGDVQRGVELSRQIQSGIVAINSFGGHLAASFGGMKSSGIGYEMGPEGMHAYMRLQSVSLPSGSAYRCAFLPAVHGEMDRVLPA